MTVSIGIALTMIAVINATLLIFRKSPTVLVAAVALTNVILAFACAIAAALASPMDGSFSLWLVVAVVAAATFGGGPVVDVGLRLAITNKESAKPQDEREGPLPAMVWIGVAERFGFTLALVLGLPTVAAILLGVKALGQYASTKNVTPATRVLGTLISVSWALLAFAIVAVGYPTLWPGIGG